MMEKKTSASEEIIAYRIEERLFCSTCYQNAVMDPQAVQDPEGPKVKLPSKSIKADQMNVFICEQCKRIGGTSVEHLKFQQSRDLTGLLDMLDHCISKVAFFGDFFSNTPFQKSGDGLFSERGLSGLNFLVRDLENELALIFHELWTKIVENRNAEKREAN
jgi:hypothetical protein